MAREARRARLDQPRAPRRTVVPYPDLEVFGRLSEKISRFIGSWRFIAYMSVFVVGYLAWNTLAPEDMRFDVWPFVGLTLMLSVQASYAAPLILLAQNRQADRDRVTYLEDRARIDRIIADEDYVSREVAALRHAIGEVATRDFIRDQLEEVLDQIEAGGSHAGAADAER